MPPEDTITRRRKERRIGTERGRGIGIGIGIEKGTGIRTKRKVVILSSISLNLKDVPGNCYLISVLLLNRCKRNVKRKEKKRKED